MPPSVSQSPALTTKPPNPMSDCPRQATWLPKQYCDKFPEPPAPVAASTGDSLLSQPVIRRVILHVRDTICTIVNAFGIFCKYPHWPSYNPDVFVTPGDLMYRGCQLPKPTLPVPEETGPDQPPPWPFSNMSIYRLMKWRYSGSIMKSQEEVNRLVHDVLLANDFRVEELSNFSIATQNSALDAQCRNSSHASDGWHGVDMDIQIHNSIPSSTGSYHHSFTISGLLYHPMTDVIKSAFSAPNARHFHLFPFKRFWRHPVDGTDQCVFDELYTSDAWLKAHNDLRKQPNEPSCWLNKVIAAMMFSSDATTLAMFGMAKVWPLYLYFGNVSKYIWVQPSAGACYHVGFIPSVGVTV